MANTFEIISFRTIRPLIFKVGMEPWGNMVYKVNINDDSELTFIYFTARSDLLKIVYCDYTRFRCQMSTYRTIGPQVYNVVNVPRHEKTGFLHMPKQRRRSASR